MREHRSFLSSWSRPCLMLGLAGALAVTGGCARQQVAESAAPPPDTTMVVPAAQHVAAGADDLVARGRFLVNLGGCNDCHTPMIMGEHGPERDAAHLLSGHPQGMTMPPPPAASGPWVWAGSATMTAFAGPWGVSYAANLTPDENTGLGIWSEEMFVTAMRTGRHMGQSRPIMPPMPWQSIGELSDEDLAAVFAYLHSLPPIVNHVPDFQPAAAPPGPAG